MLRRNAGAAASGTNRGRGGAGAGGSPTTVEFGAGNFATNVMAISASRIDCTAPAGALGAKDLIIINGRNIWPQDIEWAVEKVDGVRGGG